MADRHLAAAYGAAGRASGEAVLEHGRDGARLRPANDAFLLSRIARAATEAALTAYLDSLLGELPEEAVEAACETVGNRGDGVFARTVAKPMLLDALRSLRDSLASGREGQHEE